MTQLEIVESRRVFYIDCMKALAMVLVIMGHVNFANQSIKAWIYSFHMPVFFFCTGFFLTESIEKWSIVKSEVQKKFHRLIIPYLLWGIVFAKFTIPNLLKVLYGSYWSISSSGSLTSLWFLPAMFVALLLYYFLIWKVKVIRTIWGKLLIISFFSTVGYLLPVVKYGYLWCANVAFIAFSIMLLGNILIPYIRRIHNRFIQNRRIGVVYCFIFTIILFVGTLSYSLNNPESGYVLMGNARYGFFPLFFFSALCGILMLVSFSMLLELVQVKGSSFLSFVGQNTLCIFAVQKPIIFCFKMAFKYACLPNWMVLIVATAGTLLVSCLLCMMINKYFPIFAGKQII